MSDLTRRELQKMLGLLEETDPRTPAYRELLANIEIVFAQADMLQEAERFAAGEAADGTYGGAQADAINGAEILGNDPPSENSAEVVRETVSEADDAGEAEAPVSPKRTRSRAKKAEPEPAAEVEIPQASVEVVQYKPEEVRAALVGARRRGVNVTELMAEFGVDTFSAFPAGRYGELMDRLKE